MNTIILLFFALPIATIILSIVLQKILKCPILVAATFFAIYLVLTYIISPSLLIFAIVYTIIAYITAFLVRLFCELRERLNRCDNNQRRRIIQGGCEGSCLCDDENSRSNTTPRTCRINGCNSNDLAQTRFTLTTNQMNPVVYLTSRNNNPTRRNSCCCGRR